jgi:hypothetical protein
MSENKKGKECSALKGKNINRHLEDKFILKVLSILTSTTKIAISK